MSLIPQEPIFVGIEITSSSFKIAVLKKRGKRWIIPLLKEIPKDDTHQLFKVLPKGAILVTSLASKEVLVKNFTMPVTGEKEIKAAFEFQVEPLLPYPMEKSIVTYEKMGEREQGSLLSIFAIKKESLQSHLDICKELFTEDIDLITAPVCALKALSLQFAKTTDAFFFIHIGEREGTIALMEQGHLVASRFFEKDPVEMEKTILSLSATYKKPVETFILISEEKEWQKILEKITQKAVLYPSLVDLPIPEDQLQKYGISIGMALGASLKGFPNFRQKEFQIAFPWKRLKKPLTTLVALFCILFSGVLFFAKSYLDREEKALLQKFTYFYPQKEVKSLSELQEELFRIEKQVKDSPDLFPLMPVVPKLSNFMAWLSSQPQFQNKIVIEDLRYHMVKRPDFSKPDERYLVQVEMVFSADSANAAENIRNLLSASNAFVDTNKDVEWIIEKGKYKTVFTLKDKTHYY